MQPARRLDSRAADARSVPAVTVGRLSPNPMFPLESMLWPWWIGDDSFRYPAITGLTSPGQERPGPGGPGIRRPTGSGATVTANIAGRLRQEDGSR